LETSSAICGVKDGWGRWKNSSSAIDPSSPVLSISGVDIRDVVDLTSDRI